MVNVLFVKTQDGCLSGEKTKDPKVLKNMFPIIVWLSTFLIIPSFALEMQLGGIAISNVNDPEIQEIAEKAMEKVNMKTNYSHLYKLVKVISARTQVNSRKTDAARCVIDKSKPEKPFEIEVWSAPWQNTFEVTLI
ncbi:unnamed protein product [Litomosoides sigmodontis]|uniref:Cystatin domain-containing protein n=1 Tax=Litomosoides sigmodontis TaxID=42156 RepID=A0A3P6T485_LITSI|nr:unnamed protein product [Litomosoides sigmodontis]